MHKMFMVLSVIFFAACGGKSPPKFYKAEAVQFEKFINAKDMEAHPNLTLDKAIVNNDYPIEIAFYQDHKFYYNLPNLGDGVGTWVYDKGLLVLRAKRTIFDMYIEVHSIDEAAKNLALQFSDRFGPHTLKVDNQNL